jgi:hypothetical protein
VLCHEDLPANDEISTFLPEATEKYKTISVGGGSYIRAGLCI